MLLPTNNRNARRGTWYRPREDVVLKDPKPNDIVIPVMGPSGAGKSTFINTVAGKDVTSVGHGLNAHTAQIQHVVLEHPRNPGRRVILVDTPGFDDAVVDNSLVLRRIAIWLAKSYNDKIKLAGIVYLHEISQARRVTGTPRRNLDMLNRLCGQEATNNVILATTKWGDVRPEVGTEREKQVAAQDWKHMITLGSRMCRLDGSSKSAWAVIELLISSAEKQDAIRIQEESNTFINRPLSSSSADDTVVLVLGQTGSGRSTFINKAIGRDVATPGNELTSGTQPISYYIKAHPTHRDRRVIFVETPGFNAWGESDAEILDRIGAWLKKSFKSKMQLKLVYLYEISQTHILPTAMTPNSLCNSRLVEHSVLATTKWGNVRPDVGNKREHQLSSIYRLQMCRFRDTEESAWGIVNKIPETGALDLYYAWAGLSALVTRRQGQSIVFSFLSILF